MHKFILVTIIFLGTAMFSLAEEIESYLTFDNRPLGSASKPLVIRTYLPNLDLDQEVLSNHGSGKQTPRYSAKTGVLSSNKMDSPILGIPAGIAVNSGAQLSYVWDTTECRLLYAWNQGFLDMTSYWGNPDRGSRKKNDYVPRLVGNLFYKAKGNHPLRINGKKIVSIQYLGNRRIKGSPVFSFMANELRIETEIHPSKSPQTLRLVYRCLDNDAKLDFETVNTAFERKSLDSGELEVLIRPNASGRFTGFKEEVIKIDTANSEVGKKLYTSFGCSACHTTDGSLNHGPSFQGLSGSSRELTDGSSVAADAQYLTESIKQPDAKHVKGFPAGMMPAYPLEDKQIESLVLYIQTLK